MSRASYIILTGVVLVASAVVVGWSFFGLGINTVQTTNDNTATEAGERRAERLLPVSVRSSSVKTARAWYGFSGTIIDVRRNGDELEVMTDIYEEGVPTFRVTPTTKVSIISNGKTTATTSAFLQANQKVEIAIAYGLKQKTWDRVGEIKILQ